MVFKRQGSTRQLYLVRGMEGGGTDKEPAPKKNEPKGGRGEFRSNAGVKEIGVKDKSLKLVNGRLRERTSEEGNKKREDAKPKLKEAKQEKSKFEGGDWGG